MAIKNVTELDFELIKRNLKEHLKSQDQFTDFDFEGSGINTLLDLLAYNTQYNAMLAHMHINESFIDSAQIRSNVVSHANLLSYTPYPARAAEVELDVLVRGNSGSPTSITIPKGYRFTSTVDGESYEFIADRDYTIAKDVNDEYPFTNVRVFQATENTIRYRVNAKEPTQKFVLPETYVDTSKLVVNVYDSESSSTFTSFTNASSVLRLTGESNVYFLEEDGQGYYEITFGDGIIGRQLTGGQIVEVTFYTTFGSVANGARVFNAAGSIGGISNIFISLSEGFARASLGSDPEDIESIRRNAPRAFSAKNRTVTANDYRNLLLSEFNFIDDISVWGGEDNVPPIYGKVFVAIKPEGSNTITPTTKETVLKFLQDRNIVTVAPEIIDPNFTDISLDVRFKYDENRTSYTRTELEGFVKDAVVNYINNNVNKFDSVLRYSNLTNAIDSTLPEILNSVAYLTMTKTFTPITGVASNYDISFANAIFDENDNQPVLKSNVFTVNNTLVELSDEPIEGQEDRRNLFLIRATTGNKLPGYSEIGYVIPSEGRIVINGDGLKIDSVGTITVDAVPKNFDLYSVLDQIISVDEDNISVNGTTDSIATFGAGSATGYNAFTKRV